MLTKNDDTAVLNEVGGRPLRDFLAWLETQEDYALCGATCGERGESLWEHNPWTLGYALRDYLAARPHLPHQ